MNEELINEDCVIQKEELKMPFHIEMAF